MKGETNHPTTIDAYIAQFSENVQEILTRIRTVIREAAPEAVEKISYNMPGFFLRGGLVWFGAYKHHIGLYPRSSDMMASIPELAAYKGTKGSVHFALDQPIPYDVIRRIVEVRLAEIQEE
ncbi:MAG: iron chaperone [Anaerolineae bacterium]